MQKIFALPVAQPTVSKHILPSKHLNFSPHLKCFPTLLKNTVTGKYTRCLHLKSVADVLIVHAVFYVPLKLSDEDDRFQVEMELFPMMKEDNLRLAALTVEEEQAQYYLNRSVEVFERNLVGPQKYVALYAKYADLLSSKAQREAESFLLEKRTNDEMKTVSFLDTTQHFYTQCLQLC